SLKASKPQSLKASKPQSLKACRMISYFQLEGSGIGFRWPIVELNKKIYWRGNVEWQRKSEKVFGGGHVLDFVERILLPIENPLTVF
ncbi:hypothetical protein, partial [uncultured Bartonella sp.]|uniref:hypothetical protein n=1 Tax=uncultured Bartonella sp. TaxID=104108 RepID=UPI0025DA2632